MRHLTPRLILAASILLFAALRPPTARAQATDDDVGDKVSFLALFPNLRALPAPTFLQPGLRVTFSSGAA
ncbi:MAG TPA: hypothetical protein PK095_05985, partial [Myxococcota bacterium]|nr:hypothetical protein [Myxococcota bacterium]